MFFGTVSHASGSEARASDVAAESRGRVALVCMPWASIETPSIALGLLKRYVQAAGFRPEVYYLNIRFAERIGLDLYERIAKTGHVYTEWFFSQALFGPRGTGELNNGWPQICADPMARSLLDSFLAGAGVSARECEHLVTEQVPAFIDECAAGIDWSAYLAVGFTTMFAQSLSTLLLSKRIKQQHAGVKLVIGGANVEGEMGVEMMRAFDWIDFVVHGEAEHSFPALLDRLAMGAIDAPIAGVSMRYADSVHRGDLTPPPMANMNEVPAPDYADYLVEMELTGFRREVPITLWYESSRGCWWGAKHHCTFCGLNGGTMAYRKKDAAKVYAEIVELANNYRCLRLAAADNILANEYFAELFPKLAELDADLRLFYSVKANLRRDQLELMADAGIASIQPGIESFNSRLLQLMRKGVTAIQNIQLLKWCFELGISVNYSVLFGFPHERPDDYDDLPETFRMLAHLQPPGEVLRVVVERFSPYFFDKEHFQLEYRPWREYEYVYPARVEIPNIAFFFNGSWVGQVGDPAHYVAPARAALDEWKAHAAGHDVFCDYEKGPDYVRISDSRPRIQGGRVRPTTFDLDDTLSALLLFCDEHRSFQSIRTMMQARAGSHFTDANVRTCLDELVDKWLMFREGERYLALPVRKRGVNPRSTSNRVGN